ncbi:hypothetical protein CapIbe_003573 [Capra ibex]
MLRNSLSPAQRFHVAFVSVQSTGPSRCGIPKPCIRLRALKFTRKMKNGFPRIEGTVSLLLTWKNMFDCMLG